MADDREAAAEGILNRLLKEELHDLDLLLTRTGDVEYWSDVLRYELNLSWLIAGSLHRDVLLPRLMELQVQSMSSFHYAALRGAGDVLRRCLQLGVAVDIGLRNGSTALQLASFAGNMDMVKLIVDNFEADVNREDSRKWRALHYASIEGHQEVVQFLILRGADINSRDTEGATAAFRAYESSQNGIISILLEASGDRDILLITEGEDDNLKGESKIMQPLYASICKAKKQNTECAGKNLLQRRRDYEEIELPCEMVPNMDGTACKRIEPTNTNDKTEQSLKNDTENQQDDYCLNSQIAPYNIELSSESNNIPKAKWQQMSTKGYEEIELSLGLVSPELTGEFSRMEKNSKHKTAPQKEIRQPMQGFEEIKLSSDSGFQEGKANRLAKIQENELDKEVKDLETADKGWPIYWQNPRNHYEDIEVLSNFEPQYENEQLQNNSVIFDGLYSEIKGNEFSKHLKKGRNNYEEIALPSEFEQLYKQIENEFQLTNNSVVHDKLEFANKNTLMPKKNQGKVDYEEVDLTSESCTQEGIVGALSKVNENNEPLKEDMDKSLIETDWHKHWQRRKHHYEEIELSTDSKQLDGSQTDTEVRILIRTELEALEKLCSNVNMGHTSTSIIKLEDNQHSNNQYTAEKFISLQQLQWLLQEEFQAHAERIYKNESSIKHSKEVLLDSMSNIIDSDNKMMTHDIEPEQDCYKQSVLMKQCETEENQETRMVSLLDRKKCETENTNTRSKFHFSPALFRRTAHASKKKHANKSKEVKPAPFQPLISLNDHKQESTSKSKTEPKTEHDDTENMVQRFTAGQSCFYVTLQTDTSSETNT